MNVIYSKQAIKTLGGMDMPTKQRIRTAIELLPEGDTKQIEGRKLVTYRLRVGGWRVLYSFGMDNTIFIEKIAPARASL